MSERPLPNEIPGRIRPRRLRRGGRLREMVRETVIRPEHLVMPHFVLPAEQGRETIDSMPGIYRMGVDELVTQVAADLEGVPR